MRVWAALGHSRALPPGGSGKYVLTIILSLLRGHGCAKPRQHIPSKRAESGNAVPKETKNYGDKAK